MKAKLAMTAAALLFAVAFLLPVRVSAAAPMPVPTPSERPVYTAYKGVSIGMSTDDVRSKLGAPKEASDEQDYFEFSDRESAQVYYDAASHSVKALMVTYTGKLEGAPSLKDVFGRDAEANADGGFFKKVDYPKAGFWVSYSRTAGDEPMVIIALNKM